MKYFVSAAISIFFSVALFAAEGVVSQYSTINNLMEGKYESSLRLESILKDGDFGMGTFAGLNGEMIILDGKAYRAAYGGKIEAPDKDSIIPFAVLTTFKAKKSARLRDITGMKGLQAAVLKTMGRTDEYFAIKVTGEFEYVKSRSIPAQKEPVPPLGEVITKQSVLEQNGAAGTLVGFFAPESGRKYGSPEFHFHYINETRTLGGHLLEIKIKSALLELDEEDQISLIEDLDGGKQKLK